MWSQIIIIAVVTSWFPKKGGTLFTRTLDSKPKETMKSAGPNENKGSTQKKDWKQYEKEKKTQTWPFQEESSLHLGISPFSAAPSPFHIPPPPPLQRYQNLQPFPSYSISGIRPVGRAFKAVRGLEKAFRAIPLTYDNTPRLGEYSICPLWFNPNETEFGVSPMNRSLFSRTFKNSTGICYSVYQWVRWPDATSKIWEKYKLATTKLLFFQYFL